MPRGSPKVTMTSARARHNSLKRYRPDDDPEVLQARRELRAARAEDYIKQLVDSAPRLTEAQRSRLAVLLLSGGGEAA